MATKPGGSRRADGSPLLSPVAILAILVLVLNDHVLKTAVPGPVTGKLSDVAGLLFFPLLLAELVRGAGRLAGRRPERSVGLVAWCAVAAGAVFALVKTTAAGSSAYAWGLGGVQWLLGGGWLRVEGPRPVAVAMDPTDLLALPVLLVAVAIAWRPVSVAWRGSPSVGRLAGPALALVAGVASIATSQAQPAAMANATERVILDAAHPAAVRHVAWTSDLAGNDGQVHAIAMGSEDGAAAPPDVSVTLAPDEPVPGHCLEQWAAASAALTLGEDCGTARGGGALLIVQVPDGTLGPGERLETVLDAAIRVYTASDAAASAATVGLVFDPEPAFDGRPTAVADGSNGVVRVSRERRKVEIPLVLRVDGAALREPLAYPLVGRLRLVAYLKDSNVSQYGTGTTVTIGRGGDWLEVPQEGIEVDWLAGCRPGKRCAIPIVLRFDDVSTSFDADDEGNHGWSDIAWEVEARLQAFDGRELPASALRLVRK